MKPLFEYILTTFENATPMNTMGMGEVKGAEEGGEPLPTQKKPKKKRKKKCCKEEE